MDLNRKIPYIFLEILCMEGAMYGRKLVLAPALTCISPSSITEPWCNKGTEHLFWRGVRVALPLLGVYVLSNLDRCDSLFSQGQVSFNYSVLRTYPYRNL